MSSQHYGIKRLIPNIQVSKLDFCSDRSSIFRHRGGQLRNNNCVLQLRQCYVAISKRQTGNIRKVIVGKKIFAKCFKMIIREWHDVRDLRKYYFRNGTMTRVKDIISLLDRKLYLF